jgi:hypothetical protein
VATGSDAGDSDDELEDEDEHGGKPVPIKTTFELADTLYAEAELEETDTVYLWLGVRFFTLDSRPSFLNKNFRLLRRMLCCPTKYQRR